MIELTKSARTSVHLIEWEGGKWRVYELGSQFHVRGALDKLSKEVDMRSTSLQPLEGVVH